MFFKKLQKTGHQETNDPLKNGSYICFLYKKYNDILSFLLGGPLFRESSYFFIILLYPNKYIII